MSRPPIPAVTDPDTTPADGNAPVARPTTARSEAQVLRDLLPFLRPFTGRIALALALVIAGKLANLTVPLVLKRLVDGLDVAPTLLVLPVALLLAYGASRLSVTLFTELRQVVFARVMARVSRKVTLQVFRHLHALSLRFHLARRTGGVARDVERGGTAISDLLDWTLYTIVPTILEVVLVTDGAGVGLRLGLRGDHAGDAGGVHRVHLRDHRMAHALLPRRGRGRHPRQRARGGFAAQLRDRQVLRQRGARGAPLRREPACGSRTRRS